MIEGVRVSYVGSVTDGIQIGDEGKVLLRDGQASHVQWVTGQRAGDIVLVDDLDLVVTARGAVYEDLDSGSLVGFPVSATLNRFGVEGLYEALSEEGHIATLEPAVDDAIAMLAASIRNDPSIREVLSELEPEDGESLVVHAIVALLSDALGGD